MTEPTLLPNQRIPTPEPTALTGRINSIDVLRGFAVLGILIMNIQSFSMPDPAYFNPTVWGDMTGINGMVYFASHILAEAKFMTIFSMLFGAGIVLLCSRLEARGLKPAGIHYRRILWLLLFGALHGYLLWMGDILFWYAECGLLAYLFWRRTPRTLMIWGVALLVVGTGLYALFQWSIPYWPPEAVEGNLQYWEPSAEAMLEKVEMYRGSWTGQLADRAMTTALMQTFVFAIMGIWRVLGLMLVGMALMKWGVFSAERSRAFYVRGTIAGLLVGLPVVMYGVWQNYLHNWAQSYSMFGGSLYNYWGSILVSLAYVSIVMLWYKSGAGIRVRTVLAGVGRMAFSCYILQTLICTFLFYGQGFGFCGMVPRWGQVLVVIGVWTLVVLFTNWWLKSYRFGPLEWLWRSLTYGHCQPMRLNLTGNDHV